MISRNFSPNSRTTQNDEPRSSTVGHDNEDEFLWYDDRHLADNFERLGQRLACEIDLFRIPAPGCGLWRIPADITLPLQQCTTATDVAPLLIDRVRIRRSKAGRRNFQPLPNRHLGEMLKTEVFLKCFRELDDATSEAVYGHQFELLNPGYHDLGTGQRISVRSSVGPIATNLDTINAFLNIMEFASNADRTNAVAAALTVMLRSRWPGAKPLILTTSTRSHGGKDTVLQFASGQTRKVSVTYQATDWAFEHSIVETIQLDFNTGVVVVENARLDHRSSTIKSAFLERMLTDPKPLLQTIGRGRPVQRRNDIVFAISTNDGAVSEDLLNRALPIHLVPRGNARDRVSPIGNPRHEFLPRNREQIGAELRLMIENWKAAGAPLDHAAKHPFTDWARTIGGILKTNGFTDFLQNYGQRATQDDPVKAAIALLGSSNPNCWLTARQWIDQAHEIGVVKHLIPPIDRGHDEAEARRIGVLLSTHDEETFDHETDDARLTVRLEKARRRFDEGKISTRYRFIEVSRELLPAEDQSEPNLTMEEETVASR